MKAKFTLTFLLTALVVSMAAAQDRNRHVMIIADAGHSAITSDEAFNRTLTGQLVAQIEALDLQYGDRVSLLAVGAASMRGVVPSWQADITLQHPRARPEDLPEYLTVKMGQLLTEGAQDGSGAVFWALRYSSTRANCEAIDTSVIVLSTLHNEIVIGDDGGLSMDPGQAGRSWSGCSMIAFLGAGADHDAAENLDPVMLQDLMGQYGHSLGFRQVETRW